MASDAPKAMLIIPQRAGEGNGGLAGETTAI